MPHIGDLDIGRDASNEGKPRDVVADAGDAKELLLRYRLRHHAERAAVPGGHIGDVVAGADRGGDRVDRGEPAGARRRAPSGKGHGARPGQTARPGARRGSLTPDE